MDIVRFKKTVLVIVAVISIGTIVVGMFCGIPSVAGLGGFILLLDMLAVGCIVLDPPQRRIKRQL